MVEPLPKAVLEAADVSAVSQLILRERLSRDLGLWEQMRDPAGLRRVLLHHLTERLDPRRQAETIETGGDFFHGFAQPAGTSGTVRAPESRRRRVL